MGTLLIVSVMMTSSAGAGMQAQGQDQEQMDGCADAGSREWLSTNRGYSGLI